MKNVLWNDLGWNELLKIYSEGIKESTVTAFMLLLVS